MLEELVVVFAVFAVISVVRPVFERQAARQPRIAEANWPTVAQRRGHVADRNEYLGRESGVGDEQQRSSRGA